VPILSYRSLNILLLLEFPVACRVVLLTDHSLIGWSLERMVAQRPGFEIVLQHGLEPDAGPRLELARPDLVVVDVSQRSGLVIGCVRGLAEIVEPSRMLVLLSVMHDRLARELVSNGIGSVVLASDRVEHVGAGMDAVADGRRAHSPAVEAMIESGENGTLSESDPLAQAASDSIWDRVSGLSRREHEVLCLISEGLTKKRIAEHLGLSVKTVDNHATSLMNKLDIHDRVGLARFAFREGLTQP